MKGGEMISMEGKMVVPLACRWAAELDEPVPRICSAALMCLVLQISETSRRLWSLTMTIIQQTSANSNPLT